MNGDLPTQDELRQAQMDAYALVSLLAQNDVQGWIELLHEAADPHLIIMALCRLICQMLGDDTLIAMSAGIEAILD